MSLFTKKVMIRSQSYNFRSTTFTYLLFLLHLLLNTFASPTPPLCRQDQRDILLKIKKEFQIPTDNHGVVSWNTSTDCCSWWGVTCDEKSGAVVSLSLMIEATNVTLNSGNSLFQLQHLSYLDLSHGCLHGEIPSSIGNLSHLTHLDLSYNQLSGEVPLSVGNLNQLIEIDLSNNYLRGNIPNSFANFTKLSQLVLNGNRFTGGCIVLANLTSLFNINLSSNDFKSLFSVDLSGLHNLGQFVGSYNSFHGPFPSSLLMISSLFNIEFTNNQFEGPIDFGNISSSKLTEFHVSYNYLDGLIPGSISTLRNLAYLDLSHNNFQGHIPRSLSKLTNLTILDLSHNRLVGQVPDWFWMSSMLSSAVLSHNSFSSFGESVEVADGTTLNVLGLGSNSFQGPFPQWICKFKYLHVLDLSNNNFTGVIPQCLNSNIMLEAIKLRNNSFSGLLPYFDGPELHLLDVSRNKLAGELPKSLMNCSFLYSLNVKENKFNGTFPFWLSSLRLLIILMLGSNAFHGPVYHPSAYLGFPSLTIIDVSNNRFSGSLPQDYFLGWSSMSHLLTDEHSISYMGEDYGGFVDSIELVYKGVSTDFSQIPTILKAIDFSGNRFWGHIPRSIGLLDGLILLNFSGNGFSGNISPSLANLTILETLDLSRNNLSGEIPLGLEKLSFLSNINFSYNHLQGSLPRSTQFQTQTCSSFVGNPKLHGLEEICGEIHVPIPKPPQVHQESLLEPEEPVLNWIAAAVACVPGLFCGVVIGYIFTSYKYEWFIAR